jgi:hypothetical protein
VSSRFRKKEQIAKQGFPTAEAMLAGADLFGGAARRKPLRCRPLADRCSSLSNLC